MNENFLRKVNAATVIANALGYKPCENESPEDIIKTAVALKPELNQEQEVHLQNMLRLSESIGIVVEEEDWSEEELDKMVAGVEDWHHVIDAYDDEELSLVDGETGEEVSGINESVELVNEVLSRAERIKARARFMRTKTKREAKVQLALKKRSDTKTLNKRARRLAINMLKAKLTKKDPHNLSLTDKERVEALLSKRKNLVNRLALKLVPRVKKIEKERMSHHLYTK